MSSSLKETENEKRGWQPRKCDNPWKPNMHHGQSEVYRRMLGILNRVTEQSMPILLEQALELPISDPEHLNSILSLILSKAQDEPLFSSLYAILCSELAMKISIENSLAAACETHFLEGLHRLREYEGVFEEDSVTMELIQQEILARKRLIVHIGFVCKLERKGIVSIYQLVSMTETLIHHGDLRSMECLCRILSTAGSRLANFRPDLVESCCSILQSHLSAPDLSPRLRFLMRDTLDLRDNGWRPRPRPNLNYSGRNVRG